MNDRPFKKGRKANNKTSKSAIRWQLFEYFPYHLNFTAELMSSELARIIRKSTGLSMPEWRVMAVLFTSAVPLSTKTIAEYTTMNKVAVSRAVSALVDSGYLQRKYNPEDKRLLRLSLSENGQKQFSAVVSAASTWSDSLLREFSEEEIQQMKDFLRRLRSSVQNAATDLESDVSKRVFMGDIPAD